MAFARYGPDAPEAGHRFNPAKLLVDPYALALDRAFALHPSLFAYGDDARDADSAAHRAESDRHEASPCRVAAAERPWRDTIIYELHVKGFTATHPDVPQHLRGTFAGLAHEAAIAHLTRLGVTTLELMPCAAWIDERHLPPLGLSNYWGYNPVALMAPDPRLAPGGWREVREAVASAARRRARSHSRRRVQPYRRERRTRPDGVAARARQRQLLPARRRPRALRQRLGLRQYSRAATARLSCGSPWTRCAPGRSMAASTASASIWRRRSRGAPSGFDPRRATAVRASLQDPRAARLKLIAEPWDIGPAAIGSAPFPSLCAEWNDRYRDGVRRFWRGDARGVAELATRFAGSPMCFGASAPSRSVNFIVGA